jgi:pimeloyl-ACP methyl ester carboxylesterase
MLVLTFFCLYNFVMELYIGMSFIVPGRTKRPYDKPGWTQHDIPYGKKSLHVVISAQKNPSPLLILIHGWRSSSASVGDRGEWFANRGWHVAMIELPNHGASDTIEMWTAYRSMQAIKAVCAQLHTIIPSDSVTSATYYGHSIGGFIGLRLLTDPEYTASGQNMEGLILESPMTMYSPILDEISDKLKVPSFMLSAYRKRLMSSFNATIPGGASFTSIEQFDLPKWGVPDVPVLCIQANPDERLGMDHFLLLKNSYDNDAQRDLLTCHVLNGLSHAGARISEGRNNLIEGWLTRKA